MGYRKLDERDIAYLKKVTEDGRVLTGSDISQDYSHDELGGVERAPEALVRVLSTGEVSDIMAYANREGIPVVTRGSGTGLVGAAVAIHGGIMLETTQMNHILELDRRNLTVTVEPGVLLMELAQYVEENGLFYPPDPGEKSATIGGNISTNAGGMRAVKYGVTRDYVRALTVVLPTGEVVEFGGKTVKNSSGYSLLNLMIGSEGTLGVITRAVLKLVPLPGKTVSLLVPFADMEQAIEMVPVIVEAQIQATAIEFMESGRPSCLRRNIWANGSRIPGMTPISCSHLTEEMQSRCGRSTRRWRTCAWNTGLWTCSSWIHRRGNRACGTPEGHF